MSCDRGFATVEGKYKEQETISCPEEYRNLICSIKNVEHVKLESHEIIDLKELTNEKNKSFRHNIAKNCKFSKCRTIYLTSSDPTHMVLSYWDPKIEDWNEETVFLSDNTWPIAEMTTPREYQEHYLSKNGKNSEEIRILLPKLKEDKYDALLPKKFKPGEVYKLSKTKLKHLNELSSYVNKAGENWIKSVQDRQKSAQTKPKIPRRPNDPKLHKDDYNASCDADDEFLLETTTAKKMVSEEEEMDLMNSIEKDNEEVLNEEEDNNDSSDDREVATTNTTQTKRKTIAGAENQLKDKTVLAKKSSHKKAKQQDSLIDFPDDLPSSSSDPRKKEIPIDDKNKTQGKKVLAKKSCEFRKSDIAVKDTKSKRGRSRNLGVDQIHDMIFSSTDSNTSSSTTAGKTTISTPTTTTTTTTKTTPINRQRTLGLTKKFKKEKPK